MESQVAAADPKIESAKKITMVVYGLFAASILIGPCGIAGIILAHIKQSEAVGTIYESHMRWLIRTFWIGFAIALVGVATVAFLIGLPILLCAGVWSIYRIIKGGLRLIDNKPMYA